MTDSNKAMTVSPADVGVEVREMDLPPAIDKGPKGHGGPIELLLDTTMPISASLGQAEVQVRDLLQLGTGSVLKLDKQAGEPIELFLRGVPFATGYLVVVGNQLGVRIKEILAPVKTDKAGA